MLEIALRAVPRQTLSVQLGDSFYDISAYLCPDIMAFDIIRNGVPVVLGQRAVAGYPLIPYAYLEEGNFVVITAGDDYPDYLQFGVTQSLMYISQDELSAIRAGL